jgi:SpoVK/Ycf46/Vps4 family AAA+-type ATPase
MAKTRNVEDGETSALTSYIKAGYSTLMFHTPEEQRAELESLRAAKETKRSIFTWSITTGIADAEGNIKAADAKDPMKALENIQQANDKAIFLFRDLHLHFNNSKVLRLIRDVTREFKNVEKTLVMISPNPKLPVELERDVTLVELDLPTADEIAFVFDQLRDSNKKLYEHVDEDERDRIVQAAMGLTIVEAENAFAKATIQHVASKKNGTEESISKLVMQEKAAAVKKSGILEYLQAQEGMKDVGGRVGLKHWLQVRKSAFSKKAREFGLPNPRGILLAGLPGTGKSLVAKACSNILDVPLIKFDIGRVFGGLVGQSEQNVRKALQTIDAIGQSVVWIDEMDKAFAGMGGSGSNDSGVTQRVFGAIITWMQEKTTPSFIVATINRIEGLPPELLRKGRFDEIFFIPLPGEEEREEILNIHIKKFGRDPEILNLSECVKLSDEFSGAELREAVVDSLYIAFDKDEDLNKKFGDLYLQKAIQSTRPLSLTHKKQLDEMRNWAKKHARNANELEPVKGKKKPGGGGRKLDT